MLCPNVPNKSCGHVFSNLYETGSVLTTKEMEKEQAVLLDLSPLCFPLPRVHDDGDGKDNNFGRRTYSICISRMTMGQGETTAG